MDLATHLNTLAQVQRDRVMARSNQLTLGELIAKLKVVNEPNEKTVEFDFGQLAPRGLASWRGIYAELALGFETKPYERISVSAVLSLLEDAVGKTFTGYKGGDFVMDLHTPIWVANDGEVGNTAVVGVRDLGWGVVLDTAWKEAYD